MVVTTSVFILFSLSFVIFIVTADRISIGKKCNEANCVLLSDCPSLQHLQIPKYRKKLLSLQCDFVRKPAKGSYLPKVCCHDLTPGHRSKLLPKFNECGVQSLEFHNRIYGGEITSLREFPWMAMLIYQRRNPNNLSPSCAGVLLSKRYVLTAAHCIHHEDKTLIKVRFGEHNIKQEIDSMPNQGKNNPPVDIDVESTTIHPEYRAIVRNQISQNDIALIRLAKEVEFNEFINPICLPNTGQEIRTTNKQLAPMWVAGWGLIESGPYSNVKRKLQLKYQSDGICRRLYNISARLQFCAGGEKGKDTCNRDSGAPVMRANIIGHTTKWYATGIVSYGPLTCGQEGKPAVYTRVNAYTDWILNNLKE